jgi:ABC-type phosphate transport system substrate-binding protein
MTGYGRNFSFSGAGRIDQETRRCKRRKAKAAATEIATDPVAIAVKTPKTSVLETPEERIDDCLTAARHLDKDGLEDVIRLLRKARNAVVWKIGQ